MGPWDQTQAQAQITVALSAELPRWSHPRLPEEPPYMWWRLFTLDGPGGFCVLVLLGSVASP